MKKKLLVVVMLFTTFIFIGQESLDFIKTYEGATGDNQGFYLKLKSFSGNLQGSIFFKNKCEVFKINGTLKKDRTISINVKRATDNLIYTFTGSLENNSKISGTFNEYQNTSTFFALETTDNFDTVTLKCNEVRQTTALNSLVLEQLILTKFPVTQKSGKTWDGAATGYKADVYFAVSDQDGKTLYDMAPQFYLDLSNEKLPLLMNKKPIKVNGENLNGRLCIAFYDHDSITNHDNLGGACFSIDKNVTDSKPRMVNIDFNGVSFSLTYHFEK